MGKSVLPNGFAEFVEWFAARQSGEFFKAQFLTKEQFDWRSESEGPLLFKLPAGATADRYAVELTGAHSHEEGAVELHGFEPVYRRAVKDEAWAQRLWDGLRRVPRGHQVVE